MFSDSCTGGDDGVNAGSFNQYDGFGHKRGLFRATFSTTAVNLTIFVCLPSL